MKTPPIPAKSSMTMPNNGRVKSFATCHISALMKMKAEKMSKVGSDFIARFATSVTWRRTCPNDQRIIGISAHDVTT